jgi:hypothetical protein
MSILTNKHCCDVMEGILKRGSSALIYQANIRNYTIREIIILNKKITIGASNGILYCPWCSSKLPKPLGDEWEEELQKALKIDQPLKEEEKHLIPVEFKTDEWWKKRGL